MATDWDYIIVGGGASGLSLAYMLSVSNLSFSRVAIIEPDPKLRNDRTFSYWTSNSETDPWDSIIYKRWNTCTFKPHRQAAFSILPYTYKTLRAQDFYAFVKNRLAQDARFEWISEAVTALKTKGNAAEVCTAQSLYRAPWVFNSAFRHQRINSEKPHLYQHFKGWTIKAQHPVFKNLAPVFMDFSIPQQNDCRFMYVLPYSDNTALVEYTGFSKNTWPNEVYTQALQSYLKEWPITAYTVLETEEGCIPMSAHAFVNPYGARVVPLGTAGACTKMSSGYTFKFILSHSRQICNQLQNHTNPTPFRRSKRFEWFDKTLLQVLVDKKQSGAQIFSLLFKKHPPQRILRFLNEESRWHEEFKIMWSMPLRVFLPAALKALFK